MVYCDGRPKQQHVNKVFKLGWASGGSSTCPQCVDEAQGSGGQSERVNKECQDSLLPWGISLERLPPALVSVSSEMAVCSGCRPPQLALFSPMWPNMVWDRRVSENRAHSPNSGSATYVMKPGGDRSAEALARTFTDPRQDVYTHSSSERKLGF